MKKCLAPFVLLVFFSASNALAQMPVTKGACEKAGGVYVLQGTVYECVGWVQEEPKTQPVAQAQMPMPANGCPQGTKLVIDGAGNWCYQIQDEPQTSYVLQQEPTSVNLVQAVWNQQVKPVAEKAVNIAATIFWVGAIVFLLFIILLIRTRTLR